MEEDKCPIKISNGVHLFLRNMFGDRICHYCGYAPDGHTPIEKLMVRLPTEEELRPLMENWRRGEQES